MAEPLLRSFPPLVGAGARLLILGSMPGAASLAAQQYYAHPRNAFWPILAAWCGVAADAPYATRVDALACAGIALWDVLAECRRPGSLDSAIDLPSAQPNAIGALLDTHRGIVRVCFNGGAAANLYRRHALPGPPRVELVTLPSTSPAHAGMPLAEKMRRWRGALALTLG
jgi:TDG/mug DNA glycosylase family protein